MTRPFIRTARRLASELALSSLALLAGWSLSMRHAVPEALLVLLLGVLMVVRAVQAMLARGTLRLAWNHPRIDALKLRVPIDAIGWRAIAAGEAVLAALDSDARVYRDFFPTARRDVRLGLERALDPRTPVDEVEALTKSLRAIESRLRATTVAKSSPAAIDALDALAIRSGALADAVDELAPRTNVIPIRDGGRS